MYEYFITEKKTIYQWHILQYIQDRRTCKIQKKREKDDENSWLLQHFK